MASGLGLSIGTVQHTVENVLKISSGWLAHVLANENKPERTMASLSFLQLYVGKGNNYVHQVIWLGDKDPSFHSHKQATKHAVETPWLTQEAV
jgi:hypothetical protein